MGELIGLKQNLDAAWVGETSGLKLSVQFPDLIFCSVHNSKKNISLNKLSALTLVWEPTSENSFTKLHFGEIQTDS
jgi:hypothetical protein